MPGKEKELFFKRVEKQLSEMSEAQKDEWILIQARLLDDEEQEDFLKSLSGRKKILYMPETEEIEAFCRRVENGEIVLDWLTAETGCLGIGHAASGCAVSGGGEDENTRQTARRLKEILEHPMCDEVNPEALLEINHPEGIFSEMSALLETEITEGKA